MIDLVVEFRLLERFVLTISVMFACLWLGRKYVSHITHIVIKLKTSPVSAVSVAIGTPVLIAIIFIGYTYINLSNRIEASLEKVGNQNSKSTDCDDGASLKESIKAFKGSPPVVQSSPDCLSTQQVKEDRAAQNFALWIEQNFQRVFISILNKFKQPPEAQVMARIMNLTFAVGCLTTETDHPSRNIDKFLEDKDFDGIAADIAYGMKPPQAFINSFCRELQKEI